MRIIGCFLVVLILVPAVFAGIPGVAAQYSVRNFGAKGDGATKDTAAVQRAIDVCAQACGGTVSFPSGTYLCGSLHLRGGVTLVVGAGATILGSKDSTDYDPYEKLDYRNDADEETSFFHFALIRGEDIEHVSITGEGTIDSNGVKRGGPKAIALKRCRFVKIEGVYIVNVPNYCISLLGCDNVEIDGITTLNTFCDGIDPDACRNVRDGLVNGCMAPRGANVFLEAAGASTHDVRLENNALGHAESPLMVKAGVPSGAVAISP